MKLVHFGAGNIGRGAIPEIFLGIAKQIVFVDVNQSLVDQINQNDSYQILKTNPLKIDHIEAVNIQDTDNLNSHLVDCDVISTSVGVTNLKYVAQALNKCDNFKPHVQIVAFENNVRPTEELKKLTTTTKDGVFVDAVIDRIVPNSNNTGLDVLVEDY